MNEVTSVPGIAPPLDTPEAILAAIQTHPEWTDHQRAEVFERLIASFAPAQIAGAVKQGLGDPRPHRRRGLAACRRAR
jgi:hypothetical protein